MKTNDENELLRSTGKNGGKENVSDPFCVDKDSRAISVITHPVAWLPAFVGGCLILFSPFIVVNSDIILMLARFAAFYTSINENIQSSSNPNEALAFYAIVFSAFPFQLIFLWIEWNKKNVAKIIIQNALILPSRKRLILIIAAPVGVVVGYFGVFLVSNDPSLCAGCTSGSKLGMIGLTTAGIMAELLAFLVSITLFLNLNKILPKTSEVING
ncbi:MAG: hypothetical protein H6R15_2772 [Proteobacteria bacterium]|nr:hypothetical protein [Pseudomonadota bacterium]